MPVQHSLQKTKNKKKPIEFVEVNEILPAQQEFGVQYWRSQKDLVNACSNLKKKKKKKLRFEA